MSCWGDQLKGWLTASFIFVSGPKLQEMKRPKAPEGFESVRTIEYWVHTRNPARRWAGSTAAKSVNDRRRLAPLLCSLSDTPAATVPGSLCIDLNKCVCVCVCGRKSDCLTCNLVYTRLWKHWIISFAAEKSSFKSPNEKWRRGQQLRCGGWWRRRRSWESTGRVQTSQRSEDRGTKENRVQGGNQKGRMDETMSCQRWDKSVCVQMWTGKYKPWPLRTHKFALLLFVMSQHTLLPHRDLNI